jgi:hypothetical protein
VILRRLGRNAALSERLPHLYDSVAVKRIHSDTSIAYPRHGSCKLVHRLVYWRFNGGGAVLDRLLHLFEGAHLDLAHALARQTELVR